MTGWLIVGGAFAAIVALSVAAWRWARKDFRDLDPYAKERRGDEWFNDF